MLNADAHGVPGIPPPPRVPATAAEAAAAREAAAELSAATTSDLENAYTAWVDSWDNIKLPAKARLNQRTPILGHTPIRGAGEGAAAARELELSTKTETADDKLQKLLAPVRPGGDDVALDGPPSPKGFEKPRRSSLQVWQDRQNREKKLKWRKFDPEKEMHHYRLEAASRGQGFDRDRPRPAAGRPYPLPEAAPFPAGESDHDRGVPDPNDGRGRWMAVSGYGHLGPTMVLGDPRMASARLG